MSCKLIFIFDVFRLDNTIYLHGEQCMYSIKCQECNLEFSAAYKTRKFCSKQCSVTRSNRERGHFYNNRPLCECCQVEINRPSPSKTKRFCSKQCEGEFKRRSRIEVECQVCKKHFFATPTIAVNRKFCSRKCMGVVVKERNKHSSPQWRSYGECGIVCLMRKNYPYAVVPNDRQQLDGYEIDIWIPELRIGIEYNGQHHFKPVYGEKVFNRTKQSDKEKAHIAVEKGIKLVYVIPQGSVHKTAKQKLINLFIKCCEDAGLQQPKELGFTPDEIIAEQAK